jgi:hypothetical protein
VSPRTLAAATAALLSASACLAQVYPPGFVWNHNTDWVPGSNPGWATGNPSPDALGTPVWEAVWVTGDPLGGANPWYLGAGTRLVWDPFWFGTANPNWVFANDTAPSVGRGTFLTPGAPSAPRVAALRWIAPATLPGGLLIDGSFVGRWTNNTSTYQVAIARTPAGGSAADAQLLFSDTLSSFWNDRPQPVHLRVPTVNAGDVITLSARATADHGWWTIWYHDINFKAAKVPAYPIGFVWNRQSDWVARPEYDANTTYGNPGLDTQDQPVWSYGYTSGGALGSPNPWFANTPTALRWDPSWFGQAGNGTWVPSDDTAPSIGPSSTYNLNTASASRTGVIRWLAPATLPGGLRIQGSWSVQWVNNSQQYQAVIARLPGGRADLAEVLTSRTFTIGENLAQIPVDITVPVIQQGDVIVVSGRPVADHPWYIYFSDNLTFTHNCPSMAFSPPATTRIALRQGQTATLSASGSLVPDLPGFAPTLRWHRSGVPLTDGPTSQGTLVSGATTTDLVITNAQPADDGFYTLVATNSCGQTQSTPVRLSVYPRAAFQWQRSYNWTTPPASAAGTSAGNPDDDSLGTPVWHALYTYGGRLNSVNPWYLEPTVPMVWDTSWYGGGGAWAAGNDLNPPIGPGNLVDNRVDSAGRIPVVHWEAPIDLPDVLIVEGELSISWSGGGDQASNRAPMEVVIAHLRGGAELSRFTRTGYRQNCTSWSCQPWTEVSSIRLEFPGVQQGDRIVISGRTLTAADGHPQHGWTVLGDNLTFRYSCTPAPLAAALTRNYIGSDAAFSVAVRPASTPQSFAWRRNGVAIDPANPRFSILSTAVSSQLRIADAAPQDIGDYSCLVTSDCGQVEIQAGILLSACLADVTDVGGSPFPDGLITGDDFIAFINAFVSGFPLADIVAIGGPPSQPDGLITGDDFNAFIASFASGCP